MSTPTDGAAQPGRTRDAEQIQRDIERTRAQLGETADALAQRLSPKNQARRRLDQARERPAVLAGAAAGLAAVIVVAVLWRRHS